MYWPAAASMAKHQLANRSFCAAAFVAAATGWVSCQLAPSTWVKVSDGMSTPSMIWPAVGTVAPSHSGWMSSMRTFLELLMTTWP